MGMHWYVLHTYSGQENKVKIYVEELLEQPEYQGVIGQVLLPSQEVVQVRHGKKIRQTRKDFPSYVLIEMEMTKDAQHAVLSIPGVTHFVGVSNKPQALRKNEVDRILGRTGQDRVEASGHAMQIPYKIGEAVRINEGPFKDFDGTVEEVHPDKGKLKVMVSVFGRSTPVELDFRQVSEV